MNELPVLSGIVCLLALIVYVGMAMAVGRMRGRHGVEAPATTGHPEFERTLRVQLNTLEQLVIFIPALFLFALTIGDLWAALIGAVFVIGRILYARQYVADPKSRGPGMMLSFLPVLALLFGALGGLLLRLLF